MTAGNGRLLEGVLANLPLFKRMSRAQLADLARRVQTRQMQRGMTLCRIGEELPGAFAVAYGMVKLAVRGKSGEERVLRLVGPGETFGEALVLLDRPCPMEAIVLCDTLIVQIPAASLHALVSADPRFAQDLIAILSRRMHALVADIESSTLQNGPQRVAGYLESLATPGAAACAVRLPATKTVVAARLGITKETLSRLLRDLVQQGIVSVSRRDIVLLDRARLEALAQRGVAQSGDTAADSSGAPGTH